MITNDQNKTHLKYWKSDLKKTKMPIFKCSCGEIILVVPDLPAMEKAIRRHIVEHRRITGQTLKEETILEIALKSITEYQ